MLRNCPIISIVINNTMCKSNLMTKPNRLYGFLAIMRTFISVQCDKLKHLSNDYNVKVETNIGGIKITKVAGFFIIKEKRLIIPYVNYVKTIHFWVFFLIQTSASIFLFQFCYHSNRIYKTLMVLINLI